jgi:hypothetical protein
VHGPSDGAPKPLLIRDKEVEYWKLIVEEDERAESQRAPHRALVNEGKLGLSSGAAAQLKHNVEIHHAHSHAGRLAIANRMDLNPGGKIYFGGHFDAAKIRGDRAHLQQRAALSKWAVEVIQHLTPLRKV